MRITVLGDGSWGTTLALLLQTNGHEVTLWSAFAENAAAMIREHENRFFLPGITIPPEVKISADLNAVLTAARPQAVILAVPCQFLSGVLRQVSKLATASSAPLYVNVAKGIEMDSCLRPSEMVTRFLGPVPFCALSGPSHAEEVAQGIPTAVVAASQNPDTARQVRDVFMNEYFRVYTGSDVLGVELGGSLKNVYAIAAGACDGLGLGDNSKAALMTRSITEMARLGRALGGAPETFSGLSGIGDLIVTCISRHSRNRRVGEQIGGGKTIAAITREMGRTVAEGVKTTRSAFRLARMNQVETPIIEAVHQVLYNDKDPSAAVRDLMTREPKEEIF